MAEQFKAVGGGEFKIPFMDGGYIGGFKINGTVVAGPRLAQEEELRLQFKNSTTEILNPAVAAAGLI
jgi:hypothetical protein